MRILILIIFAICIAGTVKGQDIKTSKDDKLELSLRASTFAVSSEVANIYTVKGAQLSLGYDFFNKGFNLTPEVDVNWVFNQNDVTFRIIPGLKLGHDNFYVTSGYDLMLEIPYYGVGGLIPVTENGSGISLKIQAGMFNGFAVGYGSFGYTFKIK